MRRHNATCLRSAASDVSAASTAVVRIGVVYTVRRLGRLRNQAVPGHYGQAAGAGYITGAALDINGGDLMM